MTREEAIQILDPETSRDALLPYTYDPKRRLKVVEEACRVACAALRAQQETVTNAIENPCKDCTTGWGSVSTEGSHSCRETCERLARYRKQQEAEKNEPLTLDELREMVGEPVWIMWLDGRIVSKWWIVGGYEWGFMDFPDDMSDYGKTWLAYRRKPKEVQA